MHSTASVVGFEDRRQQALVQQFLAGYGTAVVIGVVDARGTALEPISSSLAGTARTKWMKVPKQAPQFASIAAGESVSPAR